MPWLTASLSSEIAKPRTSPWTSFHTAARTRRWGLSNAARTAGADKCTLGLRANNRSQACQSAASKSFARSAWCIVNPAILPS